MSNVVGLPTLPRAHTAQVREALAFCIKTLAQVSLTLATEAERSTNTPAADVAAQQWSVALDSETVRLRDLLSLTGKG